MAIPQFRDDGYLPGGIHQSMEAEVLFRFGSGTQRRRALALRLKRWFHMGREVKAKRMLIDGSFVSAKPIPRDLDVVIELPSNFFAQVDDGHEPAIELYELAATRAQGDLFAVFDEGSWRAWAEFFGRVRESDTRKGVVEVRL
jgi:hypothetical protein